MTQFASTLCPQTNPSNPVLLKFRERDPRYGYPAGYWAMRLSKGDLPLGVEASESQTSHAARVLTRLAALSG